MSNKTARAIVFDSGTLITFSMNCMLSIFRDLKKSFKGKFLITRDVEYEIVKRPMSIKKYKIGAIRMKNLIDEGILEFPESVGIEHNDVEAKARECLKHLNSIFRTRGRDMHIIDKGEASCLALSKLLEKKGISNVIAIDERSTRMICEKPENLKLLLERKLHTEIEMKTEVHECRNIKFIRSSELVYVAHKKGLIHDKSKDMLDALLYGVKFKGCAIASEEIKEMERT